MAISLSQLVSFFVEFEKGITDDSGPGGLGGPKRDVDYLLNLFKGYSGCEFIPLQLDFSEGIPAGEFREGSEAGPHELTSLIVNFGEKAEIYVNDMKKANGDFLLNECYRRFYTLKEAFHVIIRDEFIRNDIYYPDAKSPEVIETNIEELIYLPMSIIDLDDEKYSESEKIEHSAELLSAMILYPLDFVATDRKNFLKAIGAKTFASENAMLTNTYLYAKQYMIPQRYVNLLFRWKKFDLLYSLYDQYRDGYNVRRAFGAE